MKFLVMLTLLSTIAWAQENDKAHLPKPFTTTNGKAVFIDMSTADYKISYDLNAKSASAVADIVFEMIEEGLPIFDSVTAPTSIILDGEKVQALETKTPAGETTVRVVSKKIAAGVHTLKIELPLTNLVTFSDAGVRSSFWTSDLDERRFLEAYLPANLEYDQVKMTCLIKFVGAKTKQSIYTNGEVKDIDNETVKITYPAYYNSSSIFFHTTPQGVMSEVRFTIKSLDGRDIPSVVYTGAGSIAASQLPSTKNKIIEIIRELETDYGPFPHPTIIVYMAGFGGMEYHGATMTELRALGHELFHSYFARGVMPANGNSGWLDEALASWRDGGYVRSTTLSGSSRMSSHPYYIRTTDTQAYSFGKNFMSYMDGKLADKGGLKAFMRHMVDKRTFAPLFVEEFIKEMSEFYGVSVEEDFRRYTFSTNVQVPKVKPEHPIHRKMSPKELAKYL